MTTDPMDDIHAPDLLFEELLNDLCGCVEEWTEYVANNRVTLDGEARYPDIERNRDSLLGQVEEAWEEEQDRVVALAYQHLESAIRPDYVRRQSWRFFKEAVARNTPPGGST